MSHMSQYDNLVVAYLMAKWMVAVVVIFGGLVAYDIVNDWTDGHASSNPF